MKRISLSIFLVVITCGLAAAQQEKVLWTFPPDAKDGINPYGNLVFDRAGNLYGTTSEGGSSGAGVVFELSPQSNGSWNETVLHNFCSLDDNECPDGSSPQAGIAIDAAGNLYGTTVYGGRPCRMISYDRSCGTVWKLSPPAAGGNSWSYEVLYRFCATGGERKCEDGAYPSGPLVFDAAGNLYGEANFGGNGRNLAGVVFELAPGSSEGKSSGWSEKILYSFCSEGSGQACPDGLNPWGGVVFDQSGNLYGTTTAGGSPDGWGGGVVFKLTPGAEKWSESVLLAIPKSVNQPGGPQGGVAISPDGYLYGTIQYNGENANGSVFRMPIAGGTPDYFYFDNSDGAGPAAQILIDSKRNVLYSTTAYGGADLYGFGGTVFQIDSNWNESVAHSFCSLPHCADGVQPEGPVIEDQNGNLYGMTYGGGVVYEIETSD